MTFRGGVASCSWLTEGQVVDRGVFRFARPEHFFTWLSGVQIKDRCTWVFGHGLSTMLTLMGFWDRLGRSDEQLLSAVLEDPPTIVLTRRRRRLIRYVDTRNYWRVPLSDLKSSCGLVDLRAPEPGATDYDHLEFATRKLRIVETSVCAMIQTIHDKDLCSFQSTAASLSWSAYRHCCRSCEIWIHGNGVASQLERGALHGGRLWMKSSGYVPRRTVSLDVNSLYPHVMRSRNHPNKLVSYQESCSVQELRQALQGYWCVAEVTVESGNAARLVCPDAFLDDGSAPRVRVLCGETLRLLARAGLVIGCHRLGRYLSNDMFSGFVDLIYPEKVKAKAEGRYADLLTWKMVLNCLHGKFGQKRRHWKNEPEIIAPDRWAYWWRYDHSLGRHVRHRSVAGLVQSLHEGGETRNSFPAVASSVTDAGRREIQRVADTAPAGSVLYMDTDSLHVDEAGLECLTGAGMVHPSRLGGLKVVCDGPDSYYWGPKHYRIGDYWASNVVRLNGRYAADGIYLQESKQGLVSALERGIIDRVICSDRTVTVSNGNGSYTPGMKRIGKEDKDFC